MLELELFWCTEIMDSTLNLRRGGIHRKMRDSNEKRHAHEQMDGLEQNNKKKLVESLGAFFINFGIRFICNWWKHLKYYWNINKWTLRKLIARRRCWNLNCFG